jgi:alpha-N-arabinofuranosidase
MDSLDAEKKIALMVDEWGTWWDEEPGTISGHLYQQNSLRDAMVAALMLNVFHKYTDRVRMCNIAQVVNVLQSMILTDQKGTGHMVLTPTYHVFEMYRPFQEATSLPIALKCDSVKTIEGKSLPLLSASAARTQKGNIVLALANTSLKDSQTLDITLQGTKAKGVSGRILTSADAKDYISFEHPQTVTPRTFKDAKLKNQVLSVKLPAKSIVVLTIE